VNGLKGKQAPNMQEQFLNPSLVAKIRNSIGVVRLLPVIAGTAPFLDRIMCGS
jgi:hypothetical protein